MTLKEEVEYLKQKALDRMYEKESLKISIASTIKQIEDYLDTHYLEYIASKHFGKDSTYCAKNLIETGEHKTHSNNIHLLHDDFLKDKIDTLYKHLKALNDKDVHLYTLTNYIEEDSIHTVVLTEYYLTSKLLPYLRDAGLLVRLVDSHIIEVKLPITKD